MKKSVRGARIDNKKIYIESSYLESDETDKIEDCALYIIEKLKDLGIEPGEIQHAKYHITPDNYTSPHIVTVDKGTFYIDFEKNKYTERRLAFVFIKLCERLGIRGYICYHDNKKGNCGLHLSIKHRKKKRIKI